MESVASEAGVARATVYRRFKDKADLITAAIAANPGGRFPDRPSDDPSADLIAYLEAFDERFGESCVEVIGTLLGSREEHDALALHRRRVVEPRTGLRPRPVGASPGARGAGDRHRRRPGRADAHRIGPGPPGQWYPERA